MDEEGHGWTRKGHGWMQRATDGHGKDTDGCRGPRMGTDGEELETIRYFDGVACGWESMDGIRGEARRLIRDIGAILRTGQGPLVVPRSADVSTRR